VFSFSFLFLLASYRFLQVRSTIVGQIISFKNQLLDQAFAHRS
jgi:hypothetical protein